MTEEEKEVQAEESSTEDAGNEVDLNDVESLQQALAVEKETSNKYLANWQRAQADFSNFKKRTEQEKSETIKFANSLLMASLLPAVDDLERALESVPEEVKKAAWVEGIELIYKKMMTALEDQGLCVMDAMDQEFDPNFHQAVLYEEGDEGKVMEELQKGYMLHDRLIRPCMVKVGKAKCDE